MTFKLLKTKKDKDKPDWTKLTLEKLPYVNCPLYCQCPTCCKAVSYSLIHTREVFSHQCDTCIEESQKFKWVV